MQLFKKKAYTLYYNECQDCISHDVIIGTQTWTGCNLNVSTYRNGDTIPEIQDQTLWTNATTGAWCYYNNDPSTEATYGKLYNVYALLDPRGIGPAGYHVPTDAEWTTLTNYLGGLSVAGGKLKEEGLCHWVTPNSGATNTSGFAAFGAGTRSLNGFFSNFNQLSTFWSITGALLVGDYYVRTLNTNSTVVNVYGFGPTNGLSVRLVKDVVTPAVLSFTLSQTCSGSDVTLVANTIAGGTGPYQISTGTFANQLDAEANTNWVTATTRNFALGNVSGEYWVAVKDSTGDILAKDIYADCWDSVAAARNTADLSANAYGNSVGACASTSTQNIYIAYRNPGTLTVGDRIFVASSGSVPFNGTVVSEVQNWWKFNDASLLNGCVSGTAVRINNTGFITDVSCC